LLLQGEADDEGQVARHEASLKFLARLESIERVHGEAPAAASAVLRKLKLLIPLAGLVDLDAERVRMDKEIRRIEGEIAKCNNKLSSETFVANAPAAVVGQERARLAEWQQHLQGLSEQRGRL
jgi:valyl-tRNA synthetase